MTDFCLCAHSSEAHRDGLHCVECNCRVYEFDPFLEEGPDGKPHTTRDIPVEEREPLRLMTDEPPERPARRCRLVTAHPAHVWRGLNTRHGGYLCRGEPRA